MAERVFGDCGWAEMWFYIGCDISNVLRTTRPAFWARASLLPSAAYRQQIILHGLSRMLKRTGLIRE
jgi:hypothetical protein